MSDEDDDYHYSYSDESDHSAEDESSAAVRLIREEDVWSAMQ